MRILSHSIFVLLAFLITSELSAEVRFKHHFIDSAGPAGDAWGTNVIADFNNDGRPDVALSKSKYGEGVPRVSWYRNEGRIDRWSEEIVLRSNVDTGCGVVAFDLNGDNWTDFVAEQWMLNPGESIPEEPFEVSDWQLGELVHDMEQADFDGDGYPEIVANMQRHESPGLYIFRATSDPTQPWESQQIIEDEITMQADDGTPQGSVHAALSPRGIGDLDGDGDLDIAYVGSWAENVDGPGRQWTIHRNLGFVPEEGPWGTAVRCWIADMDNDGHNDIVQSVCDAPEAVVVWLRNVKGNGSQWETNVLPNKLAPSDFHSLVVADFDLDGDQDVYVDEMEHIHVPAGREGQFGMIAWENADGKGRQWDQQIIVTGIGGHQAQAADLDGDGDIDIVTRPYTAANVLNGGRMHLSVLENLARNPDATGPGSKFNQSAGSQ